MFKANIPKDTIKMFVIETRKDLRNFEDAMHYVETTDLGDVPKERIPKWFESEEDITEEELEQEFYTVILPLNLYRKLKLLSTMTSSKMTQ